MFLYVHLKNGSVCSIHDVYEITRVDPFKTFVIHGIIFDYDIVDYVCYVNDFAPEGYRLIDIFCDGHFVSSSYDCLKYIQPIKDGEGVVVDV